MTEEWMEGDTRAHQHTGDADCNRYAAEAAAAAANEFSVSEQCLERSRGGKRREKTIEKWTRNGQ